jgi:hypothetical protein
LGCHGELDFQYGHQCTRGVRPPGAAAGAAAAGRGGYLRRCAAEWRESGSNNQLSQVGVTQPSAVPMAAQGCWRHRGVTEGVEVGVGVGRNDDNEAATTSAGGLLHKCSSRGGSSMCAAKRRCVGGGRWGCHSSGVSKSSREDTSKTTEGAFRLVEGRGN